MSASAQDSWTEAIWQIRALAGGVRTLVEDSEKALSDDSLVSATSLLRMLEDSACKLANAIDEGEVVK